MMLNLRKHTTYILTLMTDEERYDHENRITRIHKEREYDEDVGFSHRYPCRMFTRIRMELL